MKPQSLIKEVEQENKQSKSTVLTESLPSSKETVVPELKNQQDKSVINYSSSQSLSRLKDKINQQIVDQEMYEYSRPKTGSVLHGTPTYVPHSLTEDAEKKAISTSPSQVGNGFSVTKGDNGNCSITEDLSAIGLQGKTTSGFKCGLTKDEKAFKDHMKNVLKKLGK